MRTLSASPQLTCELSLSVQMGYVDCLRQSTGDVQTVLVCPKGTRRLRKSTIDVTYLRQSTIDTLPVSVSPQLTRYLSPSVHN